MRHELPLTVPISRIIDEATGIKSILLPCDLAVRPGQFVMIWLPGVEAKPVGVSYLTDGLLGVTVSAVGPWSEKVSAMKPGDLLGIFGPYGNSFELKGKRAVLVGGGYGAASLMLLAEAALRAGLETTMIIGAKNERFLLYRERVKALGLKTIYTTDDGSFGEKGFVSDALEPLLASAQVDCVYVCGPELMEKRIAELCVAHRIPSQISVERQMKCGFGVCGACALDPSGKRVCVEGTIFPGEELLITAEFGKYHRDSSATKHFF